MFGNISKQKVLLVLFSSINFNDFYYRLRYGTSHNKFSFFSSLARPTTRLVETINHCLLILKRSLNMLKRTSFFKKKNSAEKWLIANL